MKTPMDKERGWRYATDAGLFCLALVMLGFPKGSLLYHYAEYSHFSGSGTFFRQFLENPGGLLDYAGALLTQCGRFPPLGAALLGLFAVLFRWLLQKGLGDGAVPRLLSLFPPLCALLYVSGASYPVYTPGSYGIPFTQLIGLCAATGLYLSARRFSVSGKRFSWLWPALCLVPAYLVLGFYALLSEMMILLWVLRNKAARKVSLSIVIACLAIPLVCTHADILYPRINLRYAFLGGLPYRNFTFCPTTTVPLALAIMGTLPVPILSGWKIPAAIGGGMALASCCALVFFSFQNPNFNAQLRMEEAMDKSDWDRVLRIASMRENPNRILVLYRDIALYRKGELCERMFEYPDGSAPLKEAGGIPMSLTYAPELYLRTGLLNTAERWATELSVTHVKCVRHFKVLALTALLRGDSALAEKYFSVLSENPFLRPWVKKYRALAQEPDSLARDPDLARILPLVHAGGPDFINGDVAESVVWQHFSAVDAGNPDLWQWKMAALMVQKREAAFMEEFLRHTEACPDEGIPKGIAQAAVLFGGTSGDRDLYLQVFNTFRDDRDLLKAFGAFGNSYNSARDVSSDSVRERYRQRYGKTYWYYYYFVNDIQTN